jgi:hypothetical protein
MKMPALAVALIASIALAAPTEAQTKKRKKEVQRAPVSAVQAPHPHDVYVSGEYIGRDPDPNIRLFMMRNPRIYDGPL